MAFSATLSSSAGTAPMILDPTKRSTTVLLTLTTTGSTGVVQIDMTLDDPTMPGGPSLSWGLLSSGAAMLSSNLTSGGLVYTVLSPIGGVRINSTANNTSNTFILKALQAN